jgi:transcriptional regulator with XRE-family HTH domain
VLRNGAVNASIDAMKFSEKFRKLREQKPYTNAALARKIDIHETTVGRWVKNKQLPTTDQYIALADLFGVSMRYLADEKITDPVFEGVGINESERLLLQAGRTVGIDTALKRVMAADESRPLPGQSWAERKRTGENDGGKPKRKRG